ncbi:MAG: aspartate aminotransferase family protein [Deltaproteobacteria bacterium]|nr:aspartate aminotransferase family protein [Deltaproteobacteria bacterium]
MTHPAAALYAEHVNPAFVRLLGTFGYGRVFVRARGVELWDTEERRYIDFLAGFGAASLGHNPPRLIARLNEALVQDLCHVMHIGPQALAGELGEALAQRLPALPMALLSLSGGEAVEAAIKVARAATGRPAIVSCEGGFHGSGLANLSVMGHRRWRKPFEPLLPECHRVPFGDLEALEVVLKKHRVAAFLLESIQGEAGVVMAPDNYLREAQDLCRRYGALFILDEVQTGLGRTGRLFAFQHFNGIDPDIVVLGKTLGGALVPVAATLTRRDLQEKAYGTAKTFDLHGSTYAGYALGCVVALEVLRAIKDEGLVEASEQKGRRLREGLQRRIGTHPLVREVRGRGLLVGIELGDTGSGWLQRIAPGVVNAVSREVLGQWLALRLLEAGYVCQPASQAWNVLKLTPPFTMDEATIDAFVEAVGVIFDEYRDLGPLIADVSRRIGSQYMNGWDFR